MSATFRILLVDDNEMNVELFRDVLEADGHTVTVERDGLSAHARALAEPFDLLLLDIQMPGMDGNAMCRSLRASGIKRPILALSSAAMPEHIRAGTEAGFDDYLTKPIAPSALRSTVRRFGERT
ncbi:MAG TPA: response regulator [Candidatus Limnocylindria bacterium]|nr:response regulator [Candidatus Limnocylindria bacterium]